VDRKALWGQVFQSHISKNKKGPDLFLDTIRNGEQERGLAELKKNVLSGAFFVLES
jgi:hypothetical protein